MKPTQEDIKRIFSYNPETGVIQRKNGAATGSTSRKGYLKIRVNYKSLAAHRIAWLYMYGYWPTGEIDHVNHDRSDNRIDNLRVVSGLDNSKNMSKSISNTSGFTGVCWCKKREKWRVQIGLNGSPKELGSFSSKIDAVAARIRANKEHGFHQNHGGLSNG